MLCLPTGALVSLSQLEAFLCTCLRIIMKIVSLLKNKCIKCRGHKYKRGKNVVINHLDPNRLNPSYTHNIFSSFFQPDAIWFKDLGLLAPLKVILGTCNLHASRILTPVSSVKYPARTQISRIH